MKLSKNEAFWLTRITKNDGGRGIQFRVSELHVQHVSIK